MPPEDRIRLVHMIEAADEAIGFVADAARIALV
jgi:hypothetical protein